MAGIGEMLDNHQNGGVAHGIREVCDEIIGDVSPWTLKDG